MSLSRVARRAAVLALALGVATGCAQVVRVNRLPPIAEKPPDLHLVAVAPFGLGTNAQRAGVSDTAGDLVASKLADALIADGLHVASPEDVARALNSSGSSDESPDPEKIAAIVADQFGATAVLIGRVNRFRQRSGEALGTMQAASVAFEVALHRAPDGVKLWTAVFDETQQPLTSNVFNVFRYPGGGTRWMSADELVRWGAEATAKELAAEAP